MRNESTEDRILQLATSDCVPCDTVKPFAVKDAQRKLQDLPGWSLHSNGIEKEFRFRSYLSGLDFGYSLGKIAEQQDHHPEILIGWRRVSVTISTHSIKGLSENDFIMAAKAELTNRQFLA